MSSYDAARKKRKRSSGPPRGHAMPNGNVELDLDFSSAPTFREFLSDIGEILCANMMIDMSGKLMVVPFRSGVDRSVLKSFRYESMIADFRTKYASLYVAASDGFETISVSKGTEGLELEVSGNLFLSKGSQRPIQGYRTP